VKKERKERTTSIARRINWSFWASKLCSIILFDLFLILLVATYEFIVIYKLAGSNIHNIEGIDLVTTGGDRGITIILADSSVFHSLESLIKITSRFGLAIIIYQAFSLFFSMFRTGRIRKKMAPLNVLANKAEAMGSIPFDATHLENLEKAISSVSGDEDDVRIETQDKDLAGIETALNSLLARMKESRMQQTRFVSDASHELRTPIAVIQGYVNMLDRWGKEDPAVLNESIEALKTEAQYMKELVEQLLFLARGDSGRNNLHLVDVDLRDVMREVFEESMMIDANHNYRFVVQGVDCSNEDAENIGAGPGVFETTPPMYVHADVAMIKQSMRIFVQNASKYTANGDTIVLKTDKNLGMVSYTVEDEGSGIAQEDINHIFERFYRSDAARNGKTGGSGLGLSIAKWIIDAHEGKVDVLSRKDIGTRFIVSFPEKVVI